MKPLVFFSAAVAVASLVVAVWALLRSDGVSAPPESGEAAVLNGVAPLQATPDGAVAGSLEGLRRDVAELKAVIGEFGEAPTGSIDGEANAPSVSSRLAAMDANLARLQSAFDGVSLEAASEERDKLFRGENGNLKADEYFAAGKFAIAGEGYLAFLEEHGDDPDARNILQRAREAFIRGGYAEKAIWAQEELMRNFPQNREEDLVELARMEKEDNRYDAAIEHIAEAAEMTNDPQTRLWRRMYWAWYQQLNNNQTGLESYRQVQREIADAGLTDHKLGTRVQERIEALERQLQ